MRRVLIAILIAALGFGSAPGKALAQDAHDDIFNGVGAAIILQQVIRNRNEPRERPATSQVKRDQTRFAQDALNELGFDAGAVDGIAGRKTRASVMQFQLAAGLTPTGQIDVLTLGVLSEAMSRKQRDPDSITRDTLPKIADDVRAKSRADNSVAGLTVPPDNRETSGSPRLLHPISPSRPSGGAIRKASSKNSKIRPVPTRRFSAVGQYPPSGFRGYGIMAFKSTVSSFDRSRYAMLCEAFVTSQLDSETSGIARKDQFVTVWPTRNVRVAEMLNRISQLPAEKICALAIDNIDTTMSYRALQAARAAGFDDQGIGPFLLGWLPGSDYAKEDALIFWLDLSRVTKHPQALSLFQEWRYRIENDPHLASNYSVEGWRRELRHWADKHGEGLFSVLIRD